MPTLTARCRSRRPAATAPPGTTRRGVSPPERPDPRRPPGVPAGSLAPMDVPPPDPRKLLEHWMTWERGEAPPGQVMAKLKTGGLRELLEELVARSAQASAGQDG
jgi:hypothetical protein